MKTKSLYEQVKNAKPQFKSNTEALQAFEAQLEQLAQDQQCSVTDLIVMADEGKEFSEEKMNILRLASLVRGLKIMIAEGKK